MQEYQWYDYMIIGTYIVTLFLLFVAAIIVVVFEYTETRKRR